MKSQVESFGNKKILRLYGELTIRDASELKIALNEILEDASECFINVESVTDIDLSCLQLLCAAHRTSIEQNKHLQIEQHWPAPLRQIINLIGLSPCAGGSSINTRCLWA